VPFYQKYVEEIKKEDTMSVNYIINNPRDATKTTAAADSPLPLLRD
jgi:hypothetical protein